MVEKGKTAVQKTTPTQQQDVVQAFTSIASTRRRLAVLLAVVAYCVWRLQAIHNLGHFVDDGYSRSPVVDTYFCAGEHLLGADEAVDRLLDPDWNQELIIREVKERMHLGRVVEWRPMTLDQFHDQPQPKPQIDLILKSAGLRNTQLIELLLHQKASSSMGENVVMLGWAKAALALGVRRVLLFQYKTDLVRYIHENRRQRQQDVLPVYLLDSGSLLELKDYLLHRSSVKRLGQSTAVSPHEQQTWRAVWELVYWGRRPDDIKTVLKVKDTAGVSKYGFQADHALVPFDYLDKPQDNVAVGVLPTSVTMKKGLLFNPSSDQNNDEGLRLRYPNCKVFFMGKNPELVEGMIPLIQKVEELLASKDWARSGCLCTGVAVGVDHGPAGSNWLTRLHSTVNMWRYPRLRSLEAFLGFHPVYTVNLGNMNPVEYAKLIASVRVVVGSGNPAASPTIVDAIFGGTVFMAPIHHFRNMPPHPLFIQTESFANIHDQAAEIIKIMETQDDGNDSKSDSPGGIVDDITTYSIKHVIEKILFVLRASQPAECSAP